MLRRPGPLSGGVGAPGLRKVTLLESGLERKGPESARALAAHSSNDKSRFGTSEESGIQFRP
eukprot:14798545-Alexandrium_andersonii.AAC.1